MAMTTQSEIERKYDVDGQAAVPSFEGVAGIGGAESVGEFELSAEYFDTASEDLVAHRITLRRRVGGTDEGWHLKLPATEGRTELHWPLETGTDAAALVPEEVVDPVRAIVGGRPLQLLARIATRRSVTHLTGVDGIALVEIADDLVTASDARSEVPASADDSGDGGDSDAGGAPRAGAVRTWREWEAELLSGAPSTTTERTALLDRVEERLFEAGARPAASVSKLASALGRTSLGRS